VMCDAHPHFPDLYLQQPVHEFHKEQKSDSVICPVGEAKRERRGSYVQTPVD
jgi:hypothetical protein